DGIRYRNVTGVQTCALPISNNTFAAGSLDLSVNPETIVNIDNLKPGDEVTREFDISNEGTLDITKVLLDTSYTVDDANGDNTGEIGRASCRERGDNAGKC